MSGRTPLTLAIEMGDWPIVKLLVDRGASEQEALAHAIRIKAWAIVRSLLQRGIKETVKVDAAMFAGALEDCNDVSIVKSLLDAGAPIHGEHHGINPLYWATAHGGNPQIVKLLLERGAKLEQSTGNAPSALANAIAHGQFETVKLLLDAGQDLYKAPENKTRKEIKLEGQIRDEESKPKPDQNQKLIENYTWFLEFERKNNKPRAPIDSLEHPCKKHPPNFKKDVIAYAARLGQKPAAT
jgi:ankyrin repeat protein